MPRRLANPFSSSQSAMSASEKTGERRLSASKTNRLSQLFSSSPKSKDQATMHQSQMSTISPSTVSLPTISLSTATGEQNTAESPTTLFKPQSAEEVERRRRVESQFGPLLSPEHLYVSQAQGKPFTRPIEDEPAYYYLLTTYLSYLALILFGHDRKSDDYNYTYRYTGTHTETLNMSSYNYLGFAQSDGPCADAVEECVRKYGATFASPRADSGTSDLALEVEREIASFVGKPDAMVFSMGYVTNASTFPALVSKGCLIISDELNHASIRIGARVSGAVIQSFKHNDVEALERVLREAISQGQPRTHRPWKKILVVVEGLYSMEGSMVNLPGILALKRKYKFYLFIDEAHSIGALGPRGRGICDYYGVDPSEIDILMGTLTKSFGANGGYIAAEKHIIDKLRVTNASTIFGEAPAPSVLMQILTSLKLINGEISPGQGEERLQRIAFNSRYLRLGLKRLGMIVTGDDDSPIIPVLLYHPGKMPAFSRLMLARKISVVVVGYPATPLISSRARFCVSAAHNKDDLDRMLIACDEIADILQLKYSTGIAGGLEPLPDGVAPEDEAEWRKANGIPIKPPRWKVEDVIARGVADCKLPLR
ncbi:serine palmitoyl transferase subunit [Trichoderma longibrachiatum ATCC 18648]|uniref:Serine palmitoyl transferase subunit n=1 Tax=Trichoderma longibrachiatum ATCC 18648 TaxID=983965 RepID=A0A2T4CJR5_TRILO|nr:serine palmitoyl transferase subunit [Trichoderma longibrachiatum ATCC 18648]